LKTPGEDACAIQIPSEENLLLASFPIARMFIYLKGSSGEIGIEEMFPGRRQKNRQ